MSQENGGPNGHENGNRKIAIICSKGSLDMAYPGLVLANAARMMGIDAVLFFTFWGLDIVNKKRVDKLHAGIVGNPATHMPAMIAEKKMDEIDIPPVSEFIEMLDDAGAELYACRMAMDMFELEEDALVPQIKDVISAMDFFENAEGAQVVFI
jgi:peroxiredoxin family protein